MKPIVIYESKTGFTKKYAQLISETLNCQMYSRKESKKIELDTHSVIIYGGSLYASGVLGLKKLKKRLNKQPLIVFAVGASAPKEGLIDELTAANFSEDEKDSIRFFYMRGGFTLIS